MTSVGIYVPIYHRNDYVMRSLSTLIETDISDLNVSFNFGINGADSHLRSFLVDIYNELHTRGIMIRVTSPAVNIGKPKIINELVEVTIPKPQYIVSYDSDIVVTDKLWLKKVLEVFTLYQGDTPLGAVCPQQTGNCCHVLDKDPIEYVAGPYPLASRAGNEGVAGGVLVTPYKVWQQLGGYEAHRVYASDDGHYALSCANNNLLMAVALNISVEHPHEKDPKYSDWKQRAARDLLADDEKKGFYRDI
jgi:hypothetical protein